MSSNKTIRPVNHPVARGISAVDDEEEEKEFSPSSGVTVCASQSDVLKKQELRPGLKNSYDESDILDLEKLLSEIQSLDCSPNRGILNENDSTIAKKSLKNMKNGEVAAAENVPLLHENLWFKSSGVKTNHSLAASDGVKQIKSNLHVKEKPLLNGFNQNKGIIENQPDNKISYSAANMSFVPSDCSISSSVMKNSQPSLSDLISLSKSQALNCTTNTVVKERMNNVAKSPVLNGKTSSDPLGQSPTLSLADLAKQHKSQREKAVPNTDNSSFISQKVGDDMDVQSTLVTQSLEHEKECLDDPDSVIVNLKNKIPEKSKALHRVVSSSSSVTLTSASMKENSNKKSFGVSLSQLAQKHKSPTLLSSCIAADSDKDNSAGTLSNASMKKNSNEKFSGISLSQLAQKHRSPTFPSSCVLDDSSAVSSLASTVNTTCKNPESGHKSSVAANTSSPKSSLTDSKALPDMFLTLCLKTNGSKSGTVRKMNETQPSLATKTTSVADTTTQDDSGSQQMYTDMQQLEVTSDLVSNASSLGMVLCYLKLKKKQLGSSELSRTLRYPKFMCSSQVGKRRLYTDSSCHTIEPFDFSTPSPDDVVKKKQKQAFTRPEKEFEL